MTETSPHRDADGDGDVSTSCLCLPLAPHTGVVSRLWCPVSLCLALWVMWAPQAWPIMTTGRIEACPFPSGVRSLTSGLSFYVCGGWRQCRPPARPTPSPESDHAPSGSGEAELSFSGSGEARPVPLGLGEAQPSPKGSDERSLCPRGRANWNLSPRGQTKSWSCLLIIHSDLIIGDHQFPFFGYPNIGT
jgi:hypothetical protein